MGLGLTILLALAAWALGPLILRCAGGLLAICALVLWAIPIETHTSTAGLAFTAITGAAMWHTGTIWRTRRDAARLGGHHTLPLPELIVRGIVRLRRARNTPNNRRRAGDQTRNGSHSYRPAHVDLRDEDIIDGVAYDLESNPWRYETAGGK
jgi:hypothetical protein